MSPAHEAEETARAFATRFLDGSFDEATALLTGDGRDAVVDSFPDEFEDGPMDAGDALGEYWWGLYGQYGESEGVEVTSSECGTDGEATAHDGEVTVVFAFADGTEEARVETSGERVADFSFAPTYEIPEYVDEGAFTERDATVDADDVELDGVLAVPDGHGPFPAVVLVHGAGVHDPDGTAGASKLLRDVAWGIAGEGIASLRYENRLAAHEVDDGEYTLDR
ncbi:alpha/beta hydrolase family protein, partial [Halobium palmae]